jgi:hypothetical protein
VVPAYIDGIVYSNGVVGPLLRRQNARVRFGKPVDLSPWRGRERDRAAYREAAEAIMARILALKAIE